MLFSFSSYSGNETIVDLCSKINAYRYVTHLHPSFDQREHSLYRNEYCLICHNVSQSLEISCEHQLDDELIIDPKPKTGRRSVYRLSILFDPRTFSIPTPILTLSDHQYHSSYQTHFTNIYPCRYFEVYDYILQTCLILRNEDDWQLTQYFNCTNPILIRDDMLEQSTTFFSFRLDQQRGDFVRLFSDRRKLIICGEHFSLLYIHHNRFITTIRYSSTIISLLSLLIFIISYTQKSTLHNLPGKCLLMFSISLQFSQSIFLLSGHFLEYSNHFWCISSGIAIHFFYLSTFAWLSVISFDAYLTVTRMNRLDEQIARYRFMFYNLFVWLFSFSIVFISVVLHGILSPHHPWSPNYGRILCSISSRNALISFFLLPIGGLITVNLMIFIRTIIAVRRIDEETQLARCTMGDERSRAGLFARLALLMGLHWIFLIICLTFKQDILWLLFDIINSFPGLFIAISFLRKQTSLKDVQSRIRSSQSQLSSLGTTCNVNNPRWMYSSATASPNVQMTRRLDDISQRLDQLTRHLLKPNDFPSNPSFHHRSVSSF